MPATFGYAMGAPGRRIIALIGDGSFQLTAQEVAQMIRQKLPVIIFLINNHGYTIEVEIHDGPYNNIKNWDYAGLIKAFNAEDGHGRGLRATNGGELAEAIKSRSLTAGPTLIECVIDRDDCTSDLFRGAVWSQPQILARPVYNSMMAWKLIVSHAFNAGVGRAA